MKEILKKVFQNQILILKKHSKLIAIPTTAGSGAEVTPFAVLYINKNKYSVENEFVKPDYYFIIPELIIKVKKFLKHQQVLMQLLKPWSL